MNKYITPIVVVFLLVATTTLTRAQNISTAAPPTSVSRFTDIIEGNAGLINVNTGYNTDYNSYSFGLRNVIDYNFNKHLAAGIGVGLDFRNSLTTLPITGNLRWNFTQHKVAPFLNLYMGLGFNLFGDAGNEHIAGLNAGIVLHNNNKLSLEFAVGIEFKQQINFYIEEPGFEIPSTITNVFYVPFTIGLVF